MLTDAGLPETLTLGMLDDKVWDRLGPASYKPVAHYLQRLVQRRVVHRPESNLAQQPIITTPWHPDLYPATLPFSHRTINVLERLGGTDDAEWMGTVTVDEFTAPHFSGAATLLDFATVVEAHRWQGRWGGGEPPGCHCRHYGPAPGLPD